MSPPARAGAVLVIDDDAMIRGNTAELLELSGFEAIPMAGGTEALAWCAAHPGRAALAIVDLAMPVMGGTQTFRRLRELDPTLPVIISSGSAEDAALRALLGQGLTAVLRKPARAAELLTAVRAALARGTGT